MSKEGWDLFLRMIDLNPKTRITAKQALTHTYFTKESLPECPKGQLAVLTEDDWHEYESKQSKKKHHQQQQLNNTSSIHFSSTSSGSFEAGYSPKNN